MKILISAATVTDRKLDSFILSRAGICLCIDKNPRLGGFFMEKLLRAKKLIDKNKIVNSFILIILVVIARLLPHPPNMSPLTAIMLFSGVYLNKKYALSLPLIGLFISDIFLGFYWQMPFVYGSFLITGLLGLWIRRYKTKANIVGITLLSSLQFFIITNFGVWLTTSFYPHTLSGLFNCYILALPFFRNTIMGYLLYIGLFFSSYELVIKPWFKQRIYLSINPEENSHEK